MPRESSEWRRWTIYRGADAVTQDEGFEPVRWEYPSQVEPELRAGEEVEVMPVSEHEDAYTTLEMAALEVVNQDRSTTDGEAEFEDAVHRLWLVLHAAGQTERSIDRTPNGT